MKGVFWPTYTLLIRILKWNRPRTVKSAIKEHATQTYIMYLQPCTGYIMLQAKLINCKEPLIHYPEKTEAQVKGDVKCSAGKPL